MEKQGFFDHQYYQSRHWAKCFNGNRHDGLL